jgi:CTP synthase (UTP-ammonia lyase)
VLNIADAEHAETAPEASHLMISKLVCSLVGSVEEIRLVSESTAARAYGAGSSREQFACNYGLNPEYQAQLFLGDLQAVGYGPDGEVRLVELRSHPFYVATLFLPQVRSTPQQPHPLVLGFLKAAMNKENRDIRV